MVFIFQISIKILYNRPEEIEKFAAQMIGYKLFTKQSGPQGRICNKVLVTQTLNIEKEYYFSILLDRTNACPVIVASAEGGVDIEEVSKNHPEKIFRENVDIKKGVTKEQALKITQKLGVNDKRLSDDLSKQIINLYEIFKKDATLVFYNILYIG